MKRFTSLVWAGWIALAVFPGLSAQDNTRAPARLPTVAEREGAFAEATRLALAGDLAGAEKTIATLLPMPPQSPVWRQQMGRYLTMIVIRMNSQGGHDQSVAAAQRALSYLQAVINSDAAPSLRANAFEAVAYLQERHLGDAEAAAASYRAILDLRPHDAKAAQELFRLEDSALTLERRSADRATKKAGAR